MKTVDNFADSVEVRVGVRSNVLTLTPDIGARSRHQDRESDTDNAGFFSAMLKLNL